MEASRNSSSAGTGTGCGICAYASGDSCADTGTTGTGIDSRRTGTGDSGDSGAGVRKEHSADEDGTGSVKTVQVQCTIQGATTDILMLKFANAVQLWITQLNRAGTVVEVVPVSIEESPVFDIIYQLGQRSELGLDVLAKEAARIFYENGIISSKKSLCLICSLNSYEKPTKISKLEIDLVICRHSIPSERGMECGSLRCI
eukprot:gene11304-3341_t